MTKALDYVDPYVMGYTRTETIPALLSAEREKALREAATELEVNWGHKATPEMRDAILALIDAETDPQPDLSDTSEPQAAPEVTVQQAAGTDALKALKHIEAVDDAYTRWMLAHVVGNADLVYRDGVKLSKALYDMLNDDLKDGPSATERALRALAGEDQT